MNIKVKLNPEKLKAANDALLQAFKAVGNYDLGAMIANAAERLEQERISERWRTDPLHLMPLFRLPIRLASIALYEAGSLLIKLHELIES